MLSSNTHAYPVELRLRWLQLAFLDSFSTAFLHGSVLGARSAKQYGDTSRASPSKLMLVCSLFVSVIKDGSTADGHAQ